MSADVPGSGRRSLPSLEGKVAVVTGGASGIGLAMAKRFGAEGARLVLADMAEHALDVVCDQLRADGLEVLGVPTDVSDPNAVSALGAKALERFGAVHVACNNAGTVVTGKAWEIPLEAWQTIVGVNFWGVVHGIRTFVPLILQSGEPGYVVNTASMAGVTSLPSLGPYVATKHAVVSLSEVLDHDLRQSGAAVGVSVLCPGLVTTHLGRPDKLAPLQPPGRGAISAEEVADKVREAMAVGRFYVFTHPSSVSEVAARMTGIVEGTGPALLPMPTP